MRAGRGNSVLSNHSGWLARALLLASVVPAFLAIDMSAAVAQIETVTVTARKREENVQNIPVAVTAVSGAQIAHYDLTSIEQVAATTPQLIIQRGSSGSGADISLRGIGSSFENIGIEQSVSVNVDGIYYGQGRAIDEGLFDASDVQILKGPQALFYGKNATAGAIAVETNDPTDQFEAMARVGYEFSSETPSFEGILSGPVTDDFSVRLAVRASDMLQGFIRNTAPAGNYATFDIATLTANSYPTPKPNGWLGQDQNALARLTTKWTPTGNFTLVTKATFDAQGSNNNADNTVSFYCPLGHPQLDPTNACGKHFVAQQNAIPFALAAVPGALEGKRHGQDFDDYQSYTLQANATYTGENYTLSSNTAYQHLFNDWGNDQDFTATPSVYGGEHFTWKQFSTEERLLTAFDFPVNFAGGVYYQTTVLNFNQQVIFAEAQNTAAPAGQEFVAYEKLSQTTGHTYAAFGQAIWDIMPGLQFTGGARFTHEIKQSYFIQPYVNPTLTGLFIPNSLIAAHQHFDNLSPEAMLTWKPEENLTVYGGWKQGYKSGGFSNSAIDSTLGIPADLQFRPEKAQGFEGGVKSVWLDNQLRLNFDVFDYLYTDLQVDFFNTAAFDYVTLNAASARTEGAELEAEYAPEDIAGLTLRFNGAYDEAHYGSFDAPCSPAGLTYQEGCNLLRVVTNPATGAYAFSTVCGTPANTCNFFSASGGPTALAPKWTADFAGDYDIPVNNDWILGLSGNVRFSSSYIANGFPSSVARQIDRQSSYAMLDAALRLGSADNTWELALIGKNLTDTFVIVGAQGLPLSGGTTGCASCGAQLVSDQGGVVLNPRSVAIQLTYRY